jgi:hypothetical protein
MNKRNFQIGLLTLLAPLLLHCASLGTFEKAKVEKIKRIAIVGFTYDAPLETSDHIGSALMGKEQSAGPGLMKGMKNEFTSGETPISKAAYDHLATVLKQEGWQVRSAADVQASPTLSAFYNKSVKVGYLPLQQGEARYEREKIPQFPHAASLAGKGEFAKIAQELKVDALAIVYVHAKGSASIPFVSKISHSADVMMNIFDPTEDKMIMNFSSGGKEVDGTTRTKIGKDFLADMQKGTLASIDQFGVDLKKRLQ